MTTHGTPTRTRIKPKRKGAGKIYKAERSKKIEHEDTAQNHTSTTPIIREQQNREDEIIYADGAILIAINYAA